MEYIVNSQLKFGQPFFIVFVLIIYVVLYKTSFGFGLRASSMNLQASRYAGVSEKRNIVLVMLIGGFIAGGGGGILHLSSVTKTLNMQEMFISEASYALPIALLTGNNPIGVVFTALFMVWLTVGGTMVQGEGFPTETVTMIIAIVFY